VFEFANRSSHVVKVDVGFTFSAEAPLEYTRLTLIGARGVERTDVQSKGF
jgi:hypothetical protein